jgi:hypothetical protein
MVLIVFLLVLLPCSLFAESDNGVGIILGDPTGISLAFNQRIVLGLAWDLSNHLHIHGDVWVFRQTIQNELNWYFGLGGKLLIFNDASLRGPSWEPTNEDSVDWVGLGLRVPFGLQWYPVEKLELFGEIVPGMFVFPATVFDIDVGIGARYHF